MEHDRINYFEEKAAQVTPAPLFAFGIELESRYQKKREIVEMLNFAEALAGIGLHDFVKEVWYDSQASLCAVYLIHNFIPDSIKNEIYLLAKRFIYAGQIMQDNEIDCQIFFDWYNDPFEWFGEPKATTI